MNVWTDGETVVWTRDEERKVRVARAGRVVAERELDVPWKCPLFVDPERDRIYVGSPIQVWALSTLADVASTTVRARDVAPLPDGKLLAVGRGVFSSIDGVDWKEEPPLVFATGRYGGNVHSRTRPSSRVIGGGAQITATPWGTTVSDGPNGTVASWRPGEAQWGEILHYNAEPEADLVGWCAPTHTLVLGAHAARDARVWSVPLDAEGLAIKPNAYSAWAGLRDAESALVYDDSDNSITWFGLDTTVRATRKFRTEMIRAAGAGGGVLVLVTEDGIHLVRASDADGAPRIDIETLAVVERVKIGIDPGDQPKDALRAVVRGFANGWSGSRDSNVIWLDRVDVRQADALRARIVAAGMKVVEP